MRKLLLLLLLVCTAGLANAQFLTRVYEESMEGNPPTGVTSSGTPGFAVNNTLARAGSQSMRGTYQATTSLPDFIHLTTNTINTSNFSRVWVYFSHICYIELSDSAYLEVSRDNGSTWTKVTLTNSTYLGASTNYLTRGTFAEVSYPTGTNPWVPGGASQPNNNLWKDERFDISGLANNATQLQIRFTVKQSFANGMGSPIRSGWYLDSIFVLAANSEIDPPVIAHTPLSGLQIPINVPINANITDASGVKHARVVYSVNGGPVDSIDMNRVTGNQFRGILAIPNAYDGDTVKYRLTAMDSAFNQNFAHFPLNREFFTDSFIVSGPPRLLHTPVTGLLQSIRVPISATSWDSSGILSLWCYYRTQSSSPYDSILLQPRGNNIFSDTLEFPRIVDGDTVEYYLISTDNSLRKFTTRFPATGTSSFTISGPPIITFLPITIQGDQYSLGPHVVRADINDPSGIDTARVRYVITRNGTPLPEQSALMSRLNPGSNTFQGVIPTTQDSDVICFYVEATDASVRNHYARLPLNSANPSCRTFRTFSGLTFPFTDNFDGNNIWTTRANPSSLPFSRRWKRGTPPAAKNLGVYSAPNVWYTDSNLNYTENAAYILESPVFSFNNAVNATMSFWQKRNLGSGDVLTIQYTTDVSSATPTWTTLGTNNNDPNGQNWYNASVSYNAAVQPGGVLPGWGGSTGGQWVKSSYFLSILNLVPNVRFRFVLRTDGTSNTVSTGVAIDDFSIVLATSVDAGIFSVNVPSPIVPGQNISGSTASASVVLRNFSPLALDSLKLSFRVNSGTIRDTMLRALNIQPGAFSNPIILAGYTVPNSYYDLCVWLTLPNDSVSANDTGCLRLFGIPVLNLPSNDNFDGSTVNFISTPATAGGVNSWQQGVPSKPRMNAAFSAPQAWVTNLTSSFSPNHTAFLYSPYYNFNGKYNYRLRFKMRRILPSNAGLRLTWASGNSTTYTTLGSTGALYSQNWYNGTANVNGTNGPAWRTNSDSNAANGGFVNCELDLSQFNNFGQPIRFRFEFTAGATADVGVLIDNFELVEPAPRDAGVIAFVSPNPLPDSLNAMVQVQVRIKNWGRDTLTSVPINYTLNGVYRLATPTIFNGVIPPAGEVVAFVDSFPSPPRGNYTMCARPFLAGDTSYAAKDSACISVKAILPNELQIIGLLNPRPNSCIAVGTYSVRMLVRNNGHSPVTAGAMAYQYRNNAWVNENFSNVSVLPKEIDTLTFSTPLNVTRGFAPIRLATSVTGDDVFWNDSTRATLNAIDGFKPPYFNDFEDVRRIGELCNDLRSRSWVVTNSSAGNSSPTGLELGSTSSTGWTNTNATNVWNDNVNPEHFAATSIAINTAAINNLTVKFDHKQVVTSGAAGDTQCFFRVILVNNTTGVVTQVSPTITTNTPNSPFVTREYELNNLYNAGDQVLIQFQSKARNPSGGAASAAKNANFVDNIQIYNKIPISATVQDMEFNPGLLKKGTPTLVRALVRSSGFTPINSVVLELKHQGVVASRDTFTFNPPLQFNQFRRVNLSTPFTPDTGSNDICVVSLLPNFIADSYTKDDTFCRAIPGLDEIASFPYCNEFEQGSPRWQTKNAFTVRDSLSAWRLGTPNKPLIPSAFSGTRAWYVGDNGTYPVNDTSALYTPVFKVRAGDCYKLSFKHYIVTERFDGGTVEYSTDAGRNWDQLGNADGNMGTNWFNTYFINGLWNVNLLPRSVASGWSGNSLGWITSEHPFNHQTDADVIFRFRFGSDGSVQLQGWAIDDFCFEQVTSPCAIVSVQEPGAKLNRIELYPNPSQGEVSLKFELPSDGDFQLALTDVSGRVVWEKAYGEIAAGQHTISENFQDFNSGIYFLRVNFNGQSQVQKFILKK